MKIELVMIGIRSVQNIFCPKVICLILEFRKSNPSIILSGKNFIHI